MKQNVISILHWVDHVPLCAAVTKAVGSWGGHGGLSAAETAVSYGAHTSLSAGMPTTFMATSRVLKDRARRDAARPCLPGATLALLRWAPLPTHVSWKAGKRKGPEGSFEEEWLSSLLVCKRNDEALTLVSVRKGRTRKSLQM